MKRHNLRHHEVMAKHFQFKAVKPAAEKLPAIQRVQHMAESELNCCVTVEAQPLMESRILDNLETSATDPTHAKVGKEGAFATLQTASACFLRQGSVMRASAHL